MKLGNEGSTSALFFNYYQLFSEIQGIKSLLDRQVIEFFRIREQLMEMIFMLQVEIKGKRA